MAMHEVPTYPHTPLAFPASTYDLRYGLGLQRVDPQLDASYRPFADSHERKPYLYDLQDTLVHYNIGTPIDLLSQPRPIYFTEYVCLFLTRQLRSAENEPAGTLPDDIDCRMHCRIFVRLLLP